MQQYDWLKRRICHKIKFFRLFKGISQYQMADILQMNPRSYQRIENAETSLSLETLFNIAETLELPYSKLVPKYQRLEKELYLNYCPLGLFRVINRFEYTHPTSLSHNQSLKRFKLGLMSMVKMSDQKLSAPIENADSFECSPRGIIISKQFQKSFLMKHNTIPIQDVMGVHECEEIFYSLQHQKVQYFSLLKNCYYRSKTFPLLSCNRVFSIKNQSSLKIIGVCLNLRNQGNLIKFLLGS